MQARQPLPMVRKMQRSSLNVTTDTWSGLVFAITSSSGVEESGWSPPEKAGDCRSPISCFPNMPWESRFGHFENSRCIIVVLRARRNYGSEE
jgi:hypothetical protein